MPEQMGPDDIFNTPPAGVEVVTVGVLSCPTGRLIVCDPCVTPREEEALTTAVPCGFHPVRVAIADLGTDRRIAAVRVDVGHRAACRWDIATFDQPTADAGKDTDGVRLVPVDYGVVGFLDRSTRELMGDSDPDTGEGAIPSEVLYAASRPWTCTWCDCVPLKDDSRNVIVVSAGWGDGTYPCFVGLDDDGAPTSVLVDFSILDLGLASLLSPPPPPTLEERLACHWAAGLRGSELVHALRREFPAVPLAEIRRAAGTRQPDQW